MTSLWFTLFWQCFNLNKFVGYKNERQMISDGIKKIDELKFWAGKNTIKIILKFSIEIILVNKKQHYSIPIKKWARCTKKIPLLDNQQCLNTKYNEHSITIYWDVHSLTWLLCCSSGVPTVWWWPYSSPHPHQILHQNGHRQNRQDHQNSGQVSGPHRHITSLGYLV